jgi:hypothetical protein
MGTLPTFDDPNHWPFDHTRWKVIPVVTEKPAMTAENRRPDSRYNVPL